MRGINKHTQQKHNSSCTTQYRLHTVNACVLTLDVIIPTETCYKFLWVWYVTGTRNYYATTRWKFTYITCEVSLIHLS